MLFNIGMSYTVGKLLDLTFQCSEVRNCVFEYLLPASLPFFNWHFAIVSVPDPSVAYYNVLLLIGGASFITFNFFGP